MTAKEIQHHLDSYYAPGSKYVVPNLYFFGARYCETDLLVVKKGRGLIYDVEIKISRSDFKADFKKVEKHQILSSGGRLSESASQVKTDAGWQLFSPGQVIPVKTRPNRFYFATPKDLVSINEVPEYAGLLHIAPGGMVIKVKEAPLLHKDIIDPEPILCEKFYYQARELRSYKLNNGVNALKNRIAALERELTDTNAKASYLSSRNYTIECDFKNITEKLKTIKQVAIQPVYVEFMPDVKEMQPNRLYISKKYKTAIHLCLCGCEKRVVTPLQASGWQLTENSKGVSLSPSIGNYNLACNSHYIITNNIANFV